jgi:TolB protein
MTSPEEYVIYTANLDGSDLRILGEGTWPSLSPDGARTAYSAPGGLNLADHRTGEVWHLAGTLEGDYGPRWSPDGARIAFVRVADLNLYVANADGSGLRPVTSGVEYELLAGWSPEGARLYYAVPEAAGLTLRSLDLATGAVDELFTVGSKDVPSLSPDGQWVAYADRVFGAMNYGLYLRSVDGSAPRLLAHVEGQIIAGHLWSPDGRWILASIYDSAGLDPRPLPSLIEVDTCRVVRLPWLAGYVQGWAP